VGIHGDFERLDFFYELFVIGYGWVGSPTNERI
jgi:hypothetical protein